MPLKRTGSSNYPIIISYPIHHSKDNKMEITKLTIDIESVEFNDNDGKLVEVNDAKTLDHYIRTLGLTFDFCTGLVSKIGKNNQPVECGFITTGQGIKLTFELDKMDETLKQAIHFKTHKHDIIFYDFSNGKAFQLDKTGEYVCLGQFTYRFIGAN